MNDIINQNLFVYVSCESCGWHKISSLRFFKNNNGYYDCLQGLCPECLSTLKFEIPLDNTIIIN